MGFNLAASPDGTTVLATGHRPSQTEAEEHWISPDTLEDVRVEIADSVHCCRAIGSQQVVYPQAAPKMDSVLLRSSGGQPKPLCKKCFGREAMFLDNNKVVIATWPGSTLEMVSTAGDVLYSKAVGDRDESVIGMSCASVPQRIAFVSAPQYLQENSRNYNVRVFDYARKKLV